MLNHVSSRSLFNDLLKMMSGIIMDRDPQICQTQRDERERERSADLRDAGKDVRGHLRRWSDVNVRRHSACRRSTSADLRDVRSRHDP